MHVVQNEFKKLFGVLLLVDPPLRVKMTTDTLFKVSCASLVLAVKIHPECAGAHGPDIAFVKVGQQRRVRLR